jgi:hypothetical protein
MTALSCLVNLAEANCLDNEIDIDDEMEDETLVEDAKYQRDSINTIKDFVALWADNKVIISAPEPTLTPPVYDIIKGEYDPCRCPHCNSENITAHDCDFDNDWAANYIICEDCHTSWSEVFTFAGISDLEIDE